MAHELKLTPRKRRLRRQHLAMAPATVLLSLSFLGGAGAIDITLVDIDHGGMFGLRVGDNAAHVRHLLGRPDDVTKVGSEVHWFYARFSLQMFIHRRTKRVTDLFTTDPRAKTAKGIGLGSSERAIISAYPDVLCSHGPAPHGRSCIVGGERSVTDFDVAGGHVDFIDIQPAHRLPRPLDFLMDLRSGSIFSIALGQNETQVRDTLGQPDGSFQDRADRQIGWRYSSRLIFIVYFGGRSKRVAFLETQDPRVKTVDGLGLGATEAQITHSYPRTTCGTYKTKRYCSVGGHNVVTTFNFKHGHVYEITTSRP